MKQNAIHTFVAKNVNIRVTNILRVKVGGGDYWSFQRKLVISRTPEDTAPVSLDDRYFARHPGKHSQYRPIVWNQLGHIGRSTVVDVRRVDVRWRPASNCLQYPVAVWLNGKGAITSKIKHAIKLKTSPARLAQLLQPSLAFCFSLQPMTAHFFP